MKKGKKNFLLQTIRQMNIGAGVSGAGFLLYLAASALELGLIADLIALVVGLIAVWVFLSVVEKRRQDKEAVSYNLMWGTGALALMLLFFAMTGIRMHLGL